MFSVSDTNDAFTLYKMFPREAIKLGGSLKASGIEGVLTVGYDENSPDPCHYLRVNEIMSTPPKVKSHVHQVRSSLYAIFCVILTNWLNKNN